MGEVVNGVVDTTYIKGIGLIASKKNNTFTFYIYNGSGDVIQLVNSSGTVIKNYDYDAWGVERNPDPNDTNPFRYKGNFGYYFEKETGTYLCTFRAYNPKTGRFQTENPAKDGLNWYTYGANNPLMFVDPSGLKIEIAAFDSDYYKYKLYEYDKSGSNMTQKEYDAAVIEYNRAIEYLKNGSSIFKNLYDTLMNSNIVFYMVFNNVEDAYFEHKYANYFDANLKGSSIIGTQFINWDPTIGLVMKDGTSIQSAALVLAHEFGHVGQYLDGDKWYGTRTNAILDAQKKTRENNNVKTYETPIAKQLGQPVRANYDAWSGVQRMNNSIHYRTTEIRPWYHYIGPWNWGKPRVISVTNHNS